MGQARVPATQVWVTRVAGVNGSGRADGLLGGERLVGLQGPAVGQPPVHGRAQVVQRVQRAAGVVGAEHQRSILAAGIRSMGCPWPSLPVPAARGRLQLITT